MRRSSPILAQIGRRAVSTAFGSRKWQIRILQKNTSCLPDRTVDISGGFTRIGDFWNGTAARTSSARRYRSLEASLRSSDGSSVRSCRAFRANRWPSRSTPPAKHLRRVKHPPGSPWLWQARARARPGRSLFQTPSSTSKSMAIRAQSPHRR